MAHKRKNRGLIVPGPQRFKENRLPGQTSSERNASRIRIGAAVVAEGGWRRKADSRQAESCVVENIEDLGLQFQLQVLSDRELAAESWIKLDQWIQPEDISSQGAELTDKRLSEPGIGDQIRIVGAAARVGLQGHL